MTKTSRRKSTTAREMKVNASAGRLPQVPGSFESPYSARAVAADGSVRVLDAVSIIVCLEGTEVEFDLRPVRPLLRGRLSISVRGDGVLIVGPADSSSICIAVEAFRGRRLKLI